MFYPASVILPLVMAAVLVASGVAKLRTPDDLAGWTVLGVPAALRRPWLLRLHPWAELALGLALAVLGGVLGLWAGIVAIVLMVVYLWLVVHALRTTPDASCSCFGAQRPVTRRTVARNAWLTVVAMATTAVIWMGPLWGGAILSLSATASWGWLVMVAVAAVTVFAIVWPDEAPAVTSEPAAAVPTTVDGEELDYIRTRTPAVPVTFANGRVINLRNLVAARPLLLLSVSPTCGSCTAVIENAPEWRARLPELDIRFLLRSDPVQGSFRQIEEPQSLHDLEGYVSGSIGEWATPTAILLGADGYLAGGPVTGGPAIDEFVADIRASLDEAAAAVTAP